MFRMKNGLLGSLQWLGASLLLFACAATSSAAPLTVAVASNGTYAFNDLAAAFKRDTGFEVKGVFGSSGMLAAQIKSGAPFGVFLSADMNYPDSLFQDGLAMDAPKVYANGLLVLWTMRPLDLGKGIQVLTDPSVKKVAVANPDLAPYGLEAFKVLDHYKLRDTVKAKLVYGESISQVNQYIDSGSVDIGITAKAAMFAPGISGKGKWVELPRGSYQPIAQGAVVLRYGFLTSAGVARRFLEYLGSPAARGIFEKYGYLLP